MNTFSLIEGRNKRDVYLQEDQWDLDMQITQDLMDDSPFITYEMHSDSRPTVEIRVKNAIAVYEVVNFDPISTIYTCRLLHGDVF